MLLPNPSPLCLDSPMLFWSLILFFLLACNCNPQGSLNESCNEFGICNCKPGVLGIKCDSCAENKHNLSASCISKFCKWSLNNCLKIKVNQNLNKKCARNGEIRWRGWILTVMHTVKEIAITVSPSLFSESLDKKYTLAPLFMLCNKFMQEQVTWTAIWRSQVLGSECKRRCTSAVHIPKNPFPVTELVCLLCSFLLTSHFYHVSFPHAPNYHFLFYGPWKQSAATSLYLQPVPINAKRRELPHARLVWFCSQVCLKC